MRKAVLALSLIIVLASVAAVGSQAGIAVASMAQTAQATVQATNLPSNAVIPGSSVSVLGGAATETWTPTYVAQQNFQRGYMFWMSPTRTIWVLSKTNEKDNSGVWTVYPDTYTDGEAPSDPAIVPPSANLYQPVRGFGKIWRKQQGMSEALGWGTTPEFEVITPISYLSVAGGAPGRYLITTLGREIFALYEDKAGQPGGRWQLVGLLIPGNQFTAPQAPATAAPQGAASQGTTAPTFGAIAAGTMPATKSP